MGKQAVNLFDGLTYKAGMAQIDRYEETSINFCLLTQILEVRLPL